MDDGVNSDDKTQVKMGASGNSNAARLAALQDRKKTIEEILAERNQELRELCIQEAELTGIMPLEIPLEPGESPPSFRRRIGTTYQLPQNLINNLSNKEESIVTIELQKQIQANLAEAALGLANEPNVSKTIRRQHMLRYQQHKQKYNALEEKLAFLKTRAQMSKQPESPTSYNISNNNLYNQQQKYKKKSRPTEHEDNISVNANVVDPFGKTVFRHSMRSLQHPMTTENNDYRYSSGHQRLAYRNSDNPFVDRHGCFKREEELASGLCNINLNDGRELQYEHSQSNPNLYHQHEQLHVQHLQVNSATLPHVVQRSPQTIQYSPYPYPQQFNQLDYNKYNTVNSHSMPSNQLHRQSSSSVASCQKVQYYPVNIVHGSNNHRQSVEQQFWKLNTQIQPHQQYEHNVMASGLGGYWKRSDTGELFWYTPTSPEASFQKDKRFGSLDRRKNKRVNKRSSPSVDAKHKSSPTSKYPDAVRTMPVKVAQITNRNRQDNRQLVRTQSLGSVGVQTIDNVWPSDDNSSCESDVHSVNELNSHVRKQKQKEWYETSLDGPLSPTVTSSLPINTPSTLDDKYTTSNISQPASPQQIKPVLEIPAETKPSPRVQETNLELFNNNIPKNCTVVQAGHCKPYHEETKPFEMSDFYKYSTKFKKSPSKSNDTDQNRNQPNTHLQLNAQKNLSDSFEDDKNSVIHKGIYQPLQPMKCQPYISNLSNTSVCSGNGENPSSLNGSLDLSQLTPNVADNFTAEMNAWYQTHEQKIDGNVSAPSPKNRSTATLV